MLEVTDERFPVPCFVNERVEPYIENSSVCLCWKLKNLEVMSVSVISDNQSRKELRAPSCNNKIFLPEIKLGASYKNHK
jgi:hypothetical protein